MLHASHATQGRARCESVDCSDVYSKVESSIHHYLARVTKGASKDVFPGADVIGSIALLDIISRMQPSSNLEFPKTLWNLVYRPAQSCPLRLRRHMPVSRATKWREKLPRRRRLAKIPESHGRIPVRHARRARSNATRQDRLVIAARAENTG